MAVLASQEFAKEWGGVALLERSSYQQRFLNLCAMLGAPAPGGADPAGSFYAFENRVEKTGGGKGFADEEIQRYLLALDGSVRSSRRRGLQGIPVAGGGAGTVPGFLRAGTPRP